MIDREGGSPAGSILVAGLDPLGIAIVRRLVATGRDVRALASPAELAAYAHELESLGVPVSVGAARSPGELEAAGLREVAALVLAANDDAENVDAALTARRLRPGIPLLARVFDPALAGYLEDTEPGLRVLSVSGIAAPRFADLALQAIERGAVAGEQPGSKSARPPRRRRAGFGDPVAKRFAVSVLVVVLVAVVFFAIELGVGWLDALYFVTQTMTTTGYGDFSIREASTGAKIATVLLMIAGAGGLAVTWALLAGAFVARRLDIQHGRIPERGHGHAVIAGAGNVGFRVAQLLAEAGKRVVVIERHAESRNAAQLRAEGHHVITGDASIQESFDLAAADRASVVLALTDSDATNLKIALSVRERGLGTPVIIRLLSAELSAHLHGRKGIVTISPIAVASARFADMFGD